MKKDKINNIFMIIMFICLLAYGMLALIRTPKDISYTENRNLNKFQQFTAKGFIDGTYQTGLENAFTDQFIGGGKIKDIINQKVSFSRYLADIPFICENKYVKIKSEFYFWDCNEQFVKMATTYTDADKERYEKLGEKYSELNEKYDMYYYYITSPLNYDLTKNEEVVKVSEVMKKFWKGPYKYDNLSVENAEELLSYFYKTDHHWNYKGSYNGYKDIMKLLNAEKEIKEPLETVTFDVKFYGSSSRVTSIYDYADNFTVYKFDYKVHDTYVDGNMATYGEEESYFLGKYNTTKGMNHYGIYYGGDMGEIIYDFKEKKKDNVLIIGNSFTNAINKLIASGFNKTHIIDLRHYEGAMGEKFDIDKYIEKNDIDKVLIIMDYSYMIGEEFDMWGEK